jgi:hypothetical protein
MCGINRPTAYEHRKQNSAFAAAWDDAIAESIDELGAEAFRRAMADDSTLRTFLLRAHKPEV